MNEVKWNDRFNIGVESIDKAHRRLFSIISKLISLNEDEAKQQHACREGIKYFKSYTLKHFADEEAYMQSINYKDYAIHKSLHDNMQNKTLPALEQELEAQNYSVESVQHFLGMCVGWLNVHIMVEDRAITGGTANKWVHQPAENELISLEKAVIQTFDSLLHLKAQVVSEHYSGEDFSSGKALCYRISYSAPDAKRRYVFLIYEEKLILDMLNDTLEKPIKKVDKTVATAVKLISQRFMDSVSRHFAMTKGYRPEKIDILTFSQIAKMFTMDKQYPPYSLLFSTDKNGYFAFCVK